MIPLIKKLYQSSSISKRIAAILIVDIIALGFLIAVGVLLSFGEGKGWGMAFGMIIFPLSIAWLIGINGIMLIFIARTLKQRTIAVALAIAVLYFVNDNMKIF